MKLTKTNYLGYVHSTGSALILAVVLSSLLAIVGVMFVMVSRIERISSTAASENVELDFAVDTLIAGISRQLVEDIPGMSDLEQEYYDYPDANNAWLAAIEPYQSGNDYYWSQISDITENSDILNSNIQVDIVHEYDPISESDGMLANADADGDGVGDSKWFKIDEITSSRGKPVYAAVRIVDNAAMLNVNTAFQFDPSDPNAALINIDGSHQLQIDLMALTTEPNQAPSSTKVFELLNARANNGNGNVNPFDMTAYFKNVVWNYDDPNGYTPFDLTDELELRYRYILNQPDIDTRLELWGGRLRDNKSLQTPVTSGGSALDMWFLKAAGNNTFDPNYALRHIATTHSMDRIINPDGEKLVNVNTETDPNLLYEAIRAGISDFNDPNLILLADETAARLTANLFNLRDDNTDVNEFTLDNKTYYGFEPQPFINEIAFRIASNNADTSSNNNFALELYNPFGVDISLGDFRLQLRDANDLVVRTVNFTRQGSSYVIGANSRFVITNNATSSNRFGIDNIIDIGRGKEDPNLVLATYKIIDNDPPTYALEQRYNISLNRVVTDGQLYLDKQVTQDAWFDWDEIKDTRKFYCRNDNNGNMVYQTLTESDNTLGAQNNQDPGLLANYNLVDSLSLINSMDYFRCLGDIARALIITPSLDADDMLGIRLAGQPPEAYIRLDLQNQLFSNIFQYLTVIDPAEFGHSNDETRIKGRININTAPWFVLSRLPWMQSAIAQGIVAYRDITGPFKSIAELTRVPLMGVYADDPVDLDLWPDLTPGDGSINDFEERDVIFSRISNLTTVRSDVFTAYVIVRIGVDGPQRRIIAIFDRSKITSPGDKVELLAVHQVPDPR